MQISFRYTLLRGALVAGLQLALVLPAAMAQTPPDNNCPQPALSRLKRHTVRLGETILSIAQRYQLLPESLISLNPPLKGSNPKPGQVILIPPFNGIQITAPTGATWPDLAKAYGIRADVLFEVNGCVVRPTQVFIPGIARRPTTPSKPDTYSGLPKRPLAAIAPMGLDYGWQSAKNDPNSRFFHSGIDLLAPVGTPVLAAADGTIILVSQEGPYGFLVVIDHGNGRQTRYAQLSRFSVQGGEKIRAGQAIGAVGTSGKPDISQPHLHFEVRFRSPAGWAAEDPKLHLPQ